MKWKDDVMIFVVLVVTVSIRTTFSAESDEKDRYRRFSSSFLESISGNNGNDNGNRPPNIILFLADDTAYGDFQSFGHPTQELGGIDRMVEEGMRFTQWYSPSSVCSPSRLATLTGRYPIRSGYFTEETSSTLIPPVFLPDSPGGINRNETTIAEKVKEFGYVTGMVGKWHLGINKETNTDGFYLPRNHGFDYVGTNLPLTAVNLCNPEVFPVDTMKNYCFLYNDNQIVQQPINFTTLTDKMIDDAKSFIRQNKKKKFFFYFSFSQTHRPMFCAPRFCGKSQRGEYGDNVNEMASAVSSILDELEYLNIHRNTLVLFLSDNGGIVDLCPGGGENGPFRGSKGTTFEAGIRIPAVAWWPGAIPAGSVSTSVISSMDLFPTFVNLIAGEDEPSEYAGVDGKPIEDILKYAPRYNPPPPNPPSTPRILFHYCNEILFALRYGDIKVHYFTKEVPLDEPPENCLMQPIPDLAARGDCTSFVFEQNPPLMFNLASDPAELVSLDINTPENQAILATINQLVADHTASIVPVPPLLLPGQPGLTPCCNPPTCVCDYNV